MKKFYFRLMMVMILSMIGLSTVKAQSGYETVGVGINHPVSSPNWWKPNYLYSWFEARYSATMIKNSGSINGVSFQVTGVTNGPVTRNIEIWVQETQAFHSTFSGSTVYVPSAKLSEYVKVFDGTKTISGSGWVKFDFTTPFQYSGTNSLAVLFYDKTNQTVSGGSINLAQDSCSRNGTVISLAHEGFTPFNWANEYAEHNSSSFTTPIMRIHYSSKKAKKEIIVGTEDDWESPTVQVLPAPNGSTDYNAAKQLFTPADLGSTPRWITSISFRYEGTSIWGVVPTYVDLFFKDTTGSVIAQGSGNANFQDQGYQHVYIGQGLLQHGWITYELPKPYYYDGHHSLLVGCQTFVNPPFMKMGAMVNTTSNYTSVIYNGLNSNYTSNVPPSRESRRNVVRFGYSDAAPQSNYSYFDGTNYMFQTLVPLQANSAGAYRITRAVYNYLYFNDHDAKTITDIDFMAFPDANDDDPYTIQLKIHFAEDSGPLSNAGNIASSTFSPWQTVTVSGKKSDPWIHVHLNTPFHYSGRKNLIVEWANTSTTDKAIYTTAISSVSKAYQKSKTGTSVFSSLPSDANTGSAPVIRLTTDESATLIGDYSKKSHCEYLPTRAYYGYSFTQQYYTKEEMGGAQTINGISFVVDSFENASYGWSRDLRVYLAERDSATGFLYATYWTMVFDGKVSLLYWQVGEWVHIPFNIPFHYNGYKNLVVCVEDYSGFDHGKVWFRTCGSTIRSRYAYSDVTHYSLSTVPTQVQTNYRPEHNVVKFDVVDNATEPLVYRYAVPDANQHNAASLSANPQMMLPSHIYYNYSYTQQVVNADLMGGAKQLNSIGFYLDSAYSISRNFEIYLQNILGTTSGYPPNSPGWFSPGTKVFDGTVTANGQGWVDIQLDTPFDYTGSTLLVTVKDKTGSYTHGRYFRTRPTNFKSCKWYFDDNTPWTSGIGSSDTTRTGKFINLMRFGFDPTHQMLANSNGGGQLPTNAYYRNSYTQQIYTPAEVGSQPRMINAIRLHRKSTGAITRKLVLFIDTTSRTNLQNGFIDYNQIHNKSVKTLDAPDSGWVTLRLATPFCYDGTKNLVVCVWDSTGSYTSVNYWDTVASSPAYSARRYQIDGSAPFTIPSETQGTAMQSRPYIEFESELFYHITATASPANGGTATVTKNRCSYGEIYTIQATPNPHYHFTGWTLNNGSTVYSNARSSYYTTGDFNWTAHFEPNEYTITTNVSPSNAGTVLVTNSSTGTTAATTTGLANNTVRWLKATANSGYFFSSWSDGVTQNPRSVTVHSDTTITANFLALQNFTITLNATPAEGGIVSGGGLYPQNTNRTISALPSLGYHFVQWNDGNTNIHRSINVTGNVTYTATFAPDVADIQDGTINLASATGHNTGWSDYAPSNLYYGNTKSQQIIMANELGAGAKVIDEITFLYDRSQFVLSDVDDLSPRKMKLYLKNSAKTEMDAVEPWNTMTKVFDGEIFMSAWTQDDEITFYLNTPFLYDGTSNLVLGIIDSTGIYEIDDYPYAFRFRNYAQDAMLQAEADNAVPADTNLYAISARNMMYLHTRGTNCNITVDLGNNPGAGTVSGAGTYTFGNDVTLTATPAPGWIFNGWYDSQQQYHAENPYTFTATEDMHFYADFSREWYGINAYGAPQEGGTVIITQGADTIWGGEFTYGTQLTLTAVPNDPYHFSAWSDGNTQNPRTITVTGSETYVAQFSLPNNYTISVVANPTNGGTVTGGGSYQEGTSVTLVAIANTGYHFVSWNDGNTNATRTITVTANATYTASFSPNSYTITTAASPSNGGTVSGGGNYNYGSSATLTATAATGYHFTGWTDGNANATRTVTVTGNASYTATFALNTYTVSTSVTPANSGSVLGGGTYNHGATATLTATPATGYHFVKWNDNNTNATRTITVTSNVSYTATFALNTYTVTTVANPTNGGTVSGGGSYTYGQTALLTATATAPYTFSSWSDGVTANPRTVSVTSNATYTAIFAAPSTYTITVSADPSNGGTVTGGGSYTAGTSVTLTATANTGYHFVSWNDGNTNATRTITVSANASYTATFALNSYTITTAANPTNGGTVTGGGSYNYGTAATLTATPATGYNFVQWNDGVTTATRTVTVSGNATYTATFALKTYTVTANASPANGGSVSGSGTYNHGATATLTATPAEGYHFVKWNDNNTNATRTITVTSNVTYTATFAINTYTVTTVANPSNGGTVTGGGTYNHGQSATLTATATAPYTFSSWSDGVTSNPRTVIVTSNATYTAIFAAPSTYTITVSANPSNGGTVTGGGSYTAGTSVTLTATANTGYHFVSWNDGNTNATRTITVSANASYTATFALNSYTITTTANPSNGGTVTGGGSYNHGTTATLTATPATGYNFVQWNDGVTTATRTVTVTGNATYTATFALKTYTVTVNANPTDGGSVTGGGTYNHGATATLTATPATGYHFVKWNDNNTNATRTITVTANVTYTATFALNSYTITTVANPSNGGTVTGGGSYTHGQTATLTATATAPYTFSAWSDGVTANPRTVTVTSNATYTAIFAAPSTYTITVSANPSNGGVVTGGGSYTAGTSVTLTATPNTGYHFVSWNDGNTNSTRTITVSANASYTATFALNSYTITATANPTNGGSVTGGGSYDYGATATLTATPNAGYHFVQWNDGVTTATRTVTVSGNATYTATFALNSYTITATANPADGGSVSGGGNYNHGATATLTATPNTGYHFVQWNDGITTATRTVTVTSNATYTATFALNTYTVTTVASPTNGGTVTGGGSYTHGQTATLTATATAPYTFSSWSDGVTANPRTVTVTSNATYTAIFAAPSTYTITVSANPSNGGTVTGGGSYTAGTSVTLTATANAGFTFAGWSDGNNNATRTITVTANASYVANFTANTYTVTTAANPTNGGSVTGGGTFNYGANATLTATPATGYHFVQWNDGSTVNPRTITVTANASYTATFALDSYTITVNANPALGGTVTGGGNYNYGSTATLTATANTGYTFNGWSDGVATATRTVTVTGNATYTANFTLNTYTVTLNANPANAGTVTGAGTYTHGQVATLTAVPDAGYHFTGWSDGVSNTPRTLTVISNVTITANFEADAPNNYTITVNANPANGGTVTGGGSYEAGSTATLTATANTGYTFTGWNDGVTTATRTVTVTGNATYTANFTLNTYTVTLSATPANGGTVTGAGTYNYGATATISAVANSGYHFTQWSDGDINATRTLTISGDVSLQAQFVSDAAETHTVTATCNPIAGSITGAGVYEHGETATLTAVANPGYAFQAWNDGNTDNPRVITVLSDTSFLAIFMMESYTVTVTANLANAGTVTGGGSFAYGQTTIISATANDGWEFTGWNDGNTDNPRTITVTGNASYEANFTSTSQEEYYTITVTCNPTEGSVTGTGSYLAGTQVTITATPNDGYVFAQWNDYSTENPRVITVTEDKVYVALFGKVGIDDVEADNIEILSQQGNIVVKGAEGQDVAVYDAVGRCLYRKKNNQNSEVRFEAPASGAYVVWFSNANARRIVVVKGF